jgi:hypothetical protein
MKTETKKVAKDKKEALGLITDLRSVRALMKQKNNNDYFPFYIIDLVSGDDDVISDKVWKIAYKVWNKKGEKHELEKFILFLEVQMSILTFDPLNSQKVYFTRDETGEITVLNILDYVIQWNYNNVYDIINILLVVLTKNNDKEHNKILKMIQEKCQN